MIKPYYNTSPILKRRFHRFDRTSKKIHYTGYHSDGGINEYCTPLLSLLRKNNKIEVKQQFLKHLNIDYDLSVKQVLAVITMLETDEQSKV